MAGNARFPAYDLDAAIEVARQIHERGGGVASANEVAKFLDYKSANNGAFLSRLAAARLFGLIDGQSPALRITERALDIIRPPSPDAGAQARLDAFLNVGVFAAFLEQVHGRELGAHEGLRNRLGRLGIPEKQQAVALARLLDSAEQAGLFRVAGDRSQMITPTLQQRTEATPQASEASEAAPVALATSARFPKMIEGALESLPSDRSWDEDEFREWLDLFERALRVHYRLPRPRGERP